MPELSIRKIIEKTLSGEIRIPHFNVDLYGNRKRSPFSLTAYIKAILSAHYCFGERTYD